MASLEASAAAVSVPFVIGSIAFNVGRSRLINPEHTHRWTVFLRGAHNQDLTYAISRVIFVLHVSYPDYRRGEGSISAAAASAAIQCACFPRPFPPPPPPPFTTTPLRSPSTPRRRGPRAALPGVGNGVGRVQRGG